MTDTPRDILPDLHDADDAIIEAAMSYLAGEMSDEQVEAFNRQLQDDPHQQQIVAALIWHRRMMIETLSRVQERVQGSGFRVQERELTPTPVGGRSVWYSLAAAAAVALAVTAWFVFVPEPRTQNPEPSTAPLIATLIAADDVVWTSAPLHPGQDIAAGTIAIESGSAAFMLTSGTMLELSGPSRLVIDSPLSATLTHGSATFHCPPAARGYTVHLPGHLRVVDLGTRFWVRATTAAKVEVGVAEGAVRVIGGDGAARDLHVAESARWIGGRFAGASQTAILASWDDWTDTTRPYDADSVLGGFEARIAQGSEDRVHRAFGSTDGGFGAEAGASTGGPGLLVRGANNSLVLTITLTNNTGSDFLVESFHFDFAPRRDSTSGNTGPNAFTLTYLTGGLGPDNVQIASQSNLPYHIIGGAASVSDYPDYDFDLSAALSDRILADGESARFRLEFSGHTFNDSSSIIDNVAFVGSSAPVDASSTAPSDAGASSTTTDSSADSLKEITP